MNGDPAVGAAVSGVLALDLRGVLAAIVIPKTRWFALGILAGTAVLLILAAGACVVLLVALHQQLQLTTCSGSTTIRGRPVDGRMGRL